MTGEEHVTCMRNRELMTRQISSLFLALAAVLIWGCANPVSWENDIHIPVLDDRLTWADVVPDSLYEPGTEGGPAHFVLVDTLEGWDWLDWATLPDSTVVVRYDGEVLSNDIPIVNNGSQSAVLTGETVEFNLSEPEGVQLTDAQIREGAILLKVEHSLQCNINLTCQLPGVLVEGSALVFSLEIPAATEAQAGSVTDLVDLTNAAFDFTSATGFESNALDVLAFAEYGEVTTPSGTYVISSEDSLVVSMTFQSLEVEEVGGFFGQFAESVSADVALLDTVPLPNPAIDLEGTTAALHMTNTISTEMWLFLDTLQFDESMVEGPLIAGHLITPAQWFGGEPVPGEWTLDLGDPASTFLQELESFPRSLHVGGRVMLNPNSSGELLTDRLNVNYPPTVWYELRVPLKLGINGLVFEENFELDGVEEFPNFTGHLHLDFESTFPVEVTAQVEFDRNDGVTYLDSLVLPAGNATTSNLGTATLSIPLESTMAMPGGTVAVAVLVNTNGPQPFTGHEGIRIQGRLEGTQRIEVE